VEGEQTMDLLMHYAQSGIFEAERVMRETPEIFSEDELMDFAANKVVLAKAPDILDEYKKKVREFEAINDKIQGVLSKCENIVGHYEEDKMNAVQKHTPKDAKMANIDPRLIRITADGEMIVKKQKKVVIELKKTEEY
jgi:hypothetical protein